MADTAKTQTALLALFPDNDTREITPQDLRDFAISRMAGYAQLIGSETPVELDASPGTVLTTNWFLAYSNPYGAEGSGLTADKATGKITIGVTGVYLVLWGIQGAAVAGGRVIQTAYILKNGTDEVAGLRATWTDPSAFYGADDEDEVRPLWGQGIVSLAADDYLQIKAYRDGSYPSSAYPVYLVVVRLS